MASYYIRFEDDTETVICAPNEDDASELSLDFQRNNNYCEVIVEIKQVADK